MKKKINLDALRLNSFVTSIDKTSRETAKGGAPPYTWDWYAECRNDETILCTRYGGGCNTMSDCELEPFTTGPAEY